MHEIFNMLLAVFDRAALMLICLFFLIRIRLFRELLHKSAHSPKELLAVTAIFSLFALFSTWSGVPVEGSLVNVRIIAVMSGGILFGPWVGIITGVIAGIHRYLIDIGGVTAIPCFITSILAGCISGWINLKIPKAQRWRVGILGGMLCETLTMILVIVWAPTTALGIDIVSKIGIPMILGSVCIGFIVLLVQSVEGEKETEDEIGQRGQRRRKVFFECVLHGFGGRKRRRGEKRDKDRRLIHGKPDAGLVEVFDQSAEKCFSFWNA